VADVLAFDAVVVLAGVFVAVFIMFTLNLINLFSIHNLLTVSNLPHG
jgi:hypothetical protein